MKKQCKFIAIAELVIGIPGSFAAAWFWGTDLYGNRSWFVTILILITFILSIYFSFVIFYSISQVLENQETIYERLERIDTSVSKQDEKLNTLRTASVFDDVKENIDGWRCPNCGKLNPSYVGTCACGTQKFEKQFYK